MLAAVYGFLGLIFLPFFALAGMLGAFAQHAQSDQAAPAALVGGIMLGMGIFMPIIYGVMGFIFGVIGAALYNLVARWIGGLELEVE
jgi:hypothetical protein